MIAWRRHNNDYACIKMPISIICPDDGATWGTNTALWRLWWWPVWMIDTGDRLHKCHRLNLAELWKSVLNQKVTNTNHKMNRCTSKTQHFKFRNIQVRILNDILMEIKFENTNICYRIWPILEKQYINTGKGALFCSCTLMLWNR